MKVLQSLDKSYAHQNTEKVSDKDNCGACKHSIAKTPTDRVCKDTIANINTIDNVCKSASRFVPVYKFSKDA
jgi:hypothetical protein